MATTNLLHPPKMHMLRRPYICSRCVAQLQTRITAKYCSPSNSAGRQLPALFQKRWNTLPSQSSGSAPYGRKNIPTDLPKLGQEHPLEPSKSSLPIRKRLEIWALENNHNKYNPIPSDPFLQGLVSNSMTRTQSSGSLELNHLRSSNSASDNLALDSDHEFDLATTVGVTSRSPGDLVELRSIGSRMPLFGIYLGYFGERNHYYASNGKWLTSMGYSSLFTVSKFIASPAELERVLSKIPKNGSPDDFDRLREEELGPSREDGAQLLIKMIEFRSAAEAVYQQNLAQMDGARSILSNSRDVQYLSLFEMADILLPASLKHGDVFPPHALYAIHLALYQDEIGFSPLSPSSDCHRRDHLFEVFPHSRSVALDKIAVMVRDFTEANTKRLHLPSRADLEATALGRFILEGRRAIAISRAHRQPTPHGILKPSGGVTLEKVSWSPSSFEIIKFLESWASYNLFSASSRFHGYGATILRALQVYTDLPLDQSTAWTFLQEIGLIYPWEIPSRYKVRFPSTAIVRGGGLTREVPVSLEDSRRPDVAAGRRREHNNSAIFCIDSPSTMVIDDGISLERTAVSNQYWIHIHAADPTSGVQPNSELCKYMELIPENIYLPGHFQAMLPNELREDEGQDYMSESLVQQYSLHNDSVALTFSARVNTSGEILEYQVGPSALKNVVYMDPKEVTRFCEEPQRTQKENTTLTVGKTPPATVSKPTRLMVLPEALDEESKNDLRTLYDLAEAIKAQRLSKGAWPYFSPRPSVSVHFDLPVATSTSTSRVVPADPYIKVGTEESQGASVVSNTMVLAGEIAARWCASRGVPIPYRRDVHGQRNSSQALSYATTQIYPLIQQGIEPNAIHRQELAKLTGGIEISSSPGPYFILGLDMYTKATSPLRRFSDLLVHWQIHAALAQEHKLERQIDPRIDSLDDFLPFTSTELADILPLLHIREKMGRTVARGVKDWILIALVRAWQFEKSIRRRLFFTVNSRSRHVLLGHLDLFGLGAVLDTAGLAGIVLIRDVEVNDRFEVELADANVHSGQILVKAVRHIKKDA